jgi:hypothetical protein
MLKTFTIVRRWNLRNKIAIMKCYHVFTIFASDHIVAHSRVQLKNVPNIVPSDVGSGYNEELNLYMNANYINVSIHKNKLFRPLSEEKVRKLSLLHRLPLITQLIGFGK